MLSSKALRQALLACALLVGLWLGGVPSPAYAGGGFNDITFSCPNILNYAGEWTTGDVETAYVRVYEQGSSQIIDDAFFSAQNPIGLNTFAGSFTLPQPMPSNLVLELWTGFEDNFLFKSIGLAKPFIPSPASYEAGLAGPSLPPGDWALQDQRTLTPPDCEQLDGCTFSFPIYGTALVVSQQVGYGQPNGEPARDANGDIILLLHDLDGDGADTYLIIDIQEGVNGEAWLGLFLGGCQPVYAPLSDVFPLGAIPLP